MKPNPVERSQAASATLIVLILLMLVALFLAAGSRQLHVLKRELDLIEQKQLQRFDRTPDQPNLRTRNEQSTDH